VKNDAIAKDRMIQGLKNLNLSTYEAEVYAALLSHPSMSASALCKETGISDTKIYYALDGLSEKGMLIVRNASPKIYKPVPPKEAISNLKQRLTEKLKEELKEADVLTDLLTPVYESADKQDELEVAYIINGKINIVNKMKTLISTAKKEITFFVSYPMLFRELEASLREAQDRRIRINIAMTEEMLKTENIKGLLDTRQLCCEVTLLIIDVKTLVTVTDLKFSETAMLSQDKNLIRVARDYYENSMCYIP
jgi:sugar-specific transcriptional regulator TrmB